MCSYLLIGFYFLKQSATNAGNKAFIVNRIGDFGFSLAMFLIVVQFGSLDFADGLRQVAPFRLKPAPGMLTSIALLLLVGASGKSAQIPLVCLAAGRDGWPDSGFGSDSRRDHGHGRRLHDARSAQIFIARPVAMEGRRDRIATAFFAATIGLTQNDIKKVFAYSTVSQLGYMFLGVGVGAFRPASTT